MPELPHLLEHHFQAYKVFEDSLDPLIRTYFFLHPEPKSQGNKQLKVGEDLVSLEVTSVSLVDRTYADEKDCYTQGRPFQRPLLVDVKVGEKEYSEVFLGTVPALTSRGTLLYGREPVSERVAILQLHLKPEVRLARAISNSKFTSKRKQEILAQHNQQYGTDWTEDRLRALDQSADLRNYEVRTLNHLLCSGVNRALRNISDYFWKHPVASLEEVETFLFPCLPQMFSPMVERYLSRTGLVQMLDCTNPLAEVAHKRKVTFCGLGGLGNLHHDKIAEREVHASHWGRLCPVETPESVRIGLNLHLALGAQVEGERLERLTERSPETLIGASVALIPFVEHNDMNRAMMGAKNMKQALPLLHPEPPLVKTGWETQVAQDSRLGDSPAIVNGELALGVNLLVAYMPWYGFNFEDAIVVSSRLVEEDVLTSYHTEQREGGGETVLRPLMVGDKLTGRHGNKGVVSLILDRERMPHLADGTPIDVLLNPHGVLSRMNLGQLWETHWGWVAQRRKEPVLVRPFQGILAPELEGVGDWEKLQRAWDKEGMPEGKAKVTWKKEGGEECQARVVVGYQYLMKLNHCALDKWHVRGEGPRTSITLQPPKGKKRGGGQRVGEMEVWALQAHQCPENLQELLTVKSDWCQENMGLPEATRVFLLYLRGMGIYTHLMGVGKDNSPCEVAIDTPQANHEWVQLKRWIFTWAAEEEVKKWVDGNEVREISYVETMYRCSDEICGFVAREGEWEEQGGKRGPRKCPQCKGEVEVDLAWHQEGLMGKKVFGLFETRERWQGAYIKLAQPVPHPLFQEQDLHVLYVLPPALRPLLRGDEGLNAHYRHILRVNRRLEREEYPYGSPAWRDLVRAVARLFGRKVSFYKGRKGVRFVPFGMDTTDWRSSLPACLEGKTGLVRGYLLGKRVDFSGRAVIVSDPTLPFGCCRLPYQAAEEFHLAQYGRDDLVPDMHRSKVVGDMRKFPVLLNRAPSLHRYNFLAMELDPGVPFGEEPVVALHPLVCAGFGADFDGDTMAFHLPLGEEAIQEARERLTPQHHLFSIAHGGLLLHLEQDIVAGIYLLTDHPEGREWLGTLLDDPALDQMGKPLVQAALRAAVESLVQRADAAGELKTALDKVDELMRRAFQEATERGLSFSLTDLSMLCLTLDERGELRKGIKGEDSQALQKACGKVLIKKLENQSTAHPIHVLVVSGARGKAEQMGRLCGAVTAIAPGSLSCYVEGLTPEEYFAGAQEARQDMMPKKLGTPKGGDLTRKLIYGLYPLRIVKGSCEDQQGQSFPQALFFHLLGRQVVQDVAPLIKVGEVLTEELIHTLKEQKIETLQVFSPLTCQAKEGVCQRCYGWDLSTRQLPAEGLPIGLLAAQSIGERATQDFMKVFQGAEAEVLKKIEEAKALMEWGKIPSGVEPDPISLLTWLVGVYENKVNARHFEVVLRQMKVDDGWRGMVKVARNRKDDGSAEYGPLAAAAFQYPVQVLATAAQKGLQDSLTVEPAPLLLGRAFGEEAKDDGRTNS